MKYTIIFALLVGLAVDVESKSLKRDVKAGTLSRSERVTCDLLSIDTKIGSLNHAACAAHCLIKGSKGGYCEKGVCNCRN